MTDLQNARINTAGAYVCVNGYYPFAIGIQPHHGRIPIVRLGGHREAHETGWQCAAREVYEETKLQIKPLAPQTTYLCDWDDIETELREFQWQHKIYKWGWQGNHERCIRHEAGSGAICSTSFTIKNIERTIRTRTGLMQQAIRLERELNYGMLDMQIQHWREKNLARSDDL